MQPVIADAPWGAGTAVLNADKKGQPKAPRVIPVKVIFTDKTLVYNIDGTVTEQT